MARPSASSWNLKASPQNTNRRLGQCRTLWPGVWPPVWTSLGGPAEPACASSAPSARPSTCSASSAERPKGHETGSAWAHGSCSLWTTTSGPNRSATRHAEPSTWLCENASQRTPPRSAIQSSAASEVHPAPSQWTLPASVSTNHPAGPIPTAGSDSIIQTPSSTSRQVVSRLAATTGAGRKSQPSGGSGWR